jgi:DNA-binding SARP family transcriptional activator
MPEPWYVQLFGGVRARRGELRVDRFRTQKTAALLGYLAYYRRPHPREELAELLWPDQDPASSRHNLSVALHALRQSLEVGDLTAGSVLVADRGSIYLREGSVSTDVERFAAHLRAAEEATEDADRAAQLAAAVAQYQGELLAGSYESWVFSEQQHQAVRFAQALRTLTGLQERLGSPSRALESAVRAVAADPLSEELHREVMRLYLACGEPAAALKQFRELTRLLRDELDAVPSAAAQSLARRAKEGLTLAAAPEGSETVRSSLTPAPAAIPVIGAAPASPPDGVPLAAPAGTMPLGARLYVERPIDAALREGVASATTLLLLKGSRQTGKSSLLIRGLRAARESGARTVLTDLQALDAAALATPDAFLRALALELSFQLGMRQAPAEIWDPDWGPSMNFRALLLQLLEAEEGRLVWGIDSTDRLFSCDFQSEVFGLFRSWHNQAALDGDGPWARLTLVMAYASEAHLFITDPNQSPFNVGVRLELNDFTLEETAGLNGRWGTPLPTDEEVERFHALTGGHPYLVQAGLHFAARTGAGTGTSERLACEVESEESPFADHLRRLRGLLGRDPALCEAVREVLRGRPCPGPELFYRLRSLGVLRGETAATARVRSPLYGVYLTRHLLAEGHETELR